MLTPELDAALKELIKQWNVAERRIKKAEQVRGGEVVSSAIFELRYAGRKIVDAIDLSLRSDLAAEADAREKVHSYIADATEDCVKAKHDAIDAMMDFIVLWFADIERRLSLDKLQQFFPEYLEVSGMIAGVQNRIEESRGDRTKLRDAIYDQIDGPEYDKVIALYDKMRLSRDRVEAEIQRERHKELFLVIIAVLALAIAIWEAFI